jgi:arabinofuranosyltransferase
MSAGPDETASKPARVRWITLAPLLLCIGYAIHALLIDYIADDGLIVLQYVKHFAAGDGFVYNADERVEGSSTFLWLALLGVLMRWGPGLELIGLAQTIGVLFGAATIWLVCRYSREVCGERGAFGLLAGAFLAVHTSFTAWATSGLETVMFAGLLFAAAYSYVDYLETGRRYLLPSFLFALVALTRPEGILFAGLTGLHFVGWEVRRIGRLDLARPLAWAGLFAVIYVAHAAGRYAFYGELLPNTFYVKVGTSGQYGLGWRYVGGYFTKYGVLVFVPVVWLLCRRGRVHWQDYFALLVLPYLLYVVYVGGDGLQFHRFFVHVAPLLYLLVQAAYAAAFRAVRRAPTPLPAWATTAGALLGVALSLFYTTRESALPMLAPGFGRWYEPHSEMRFPGNGEDHDYVWFENYFVDRQAVAARWLEANAPPDSLVASTPGGAIAYHMSHRVIDMLGLNDHHIARTEPGRIGFPRPGHMKGDGDYVLSREPDYILMGNVAVLGFALDAEKMGEKLVRKSEHELWADPRFHRDYEIVNVQLADEGPFRYFTFYQRRSAADEQ